MTKVIYIPGCLNCIFYGNDSHNGCDKTDKTFLEIPFLEKIPGKNYSGYDPNWIDSDCLLNDLEIMSTVRQKVFDKIDAERKKQITKWGIQDLSPEEWLAIAIEEGGETAQAMLHDKRGGNHAGTMEKELLHWTAVLVQWMEGLEEIE